MSGGSPSRRLSRRHLLALGSLAGGALLAACGAPATPTVPAKPTEPPKPALAPTPPPEKAAGAATAAPTTAAAATKPAAATTAPAAAATTAPAAAATTGAAGAARTTVPRDKTLIIGFEGGPVQAPEQANPYVAGAPLSQGNHQLMIESLYYLNYEDGKPIPWLAESHQYNADFTEVEIKLRKGVEWSDGKPFSADDVAFTLDLLRNEKSTSLTYGPEMAQWVKEVKVVDPQTVKISLKAAYPRFIFNNFTVHIWGAVRILPKHIWQDKDPMTFSNFDLAKGYPVWTGPYKMVKASSVEFVFDRNDAWWGAKSGFKPLPAPERVVLIEAGADDKKAAALQANDVDGQPSLRLDTFLKVKQANPNAVAWFDKEPYAWIDPCPPTMGFNNERAPWNNVEMRWAVSNAIDRKKYAEAAGFGIGLPARYNFPFYAPLENLLKKNEDLFEKYNTLEYNPQKARSRIEAQGYKLNGQQIFEKDGQPLKLNLLMTSIAAPLPHIAIVVSNLKAIGIDVSPNALANTQYFDLRNRANFEIETSHVACGSVVDPFAEVNLFHSRWIRPAGEIRSNNAWGYKNPDYDQVVDKIGGLQPGDAGIEPLFRQALEMRLRDLPHMALAQQFRVVPYSTKYWTNWPNAANNYIHPPNWWMTTLMIVMNVKPAAK